MEENKYKGLKALIESQAKQQRELVYNQGTESEFCVKIFPVIPYTKRMEMVYFIYSFAFDDAAENIEEYAPHNVEYGKKLAALRFYTDIELPDNIDDIWLVLNHSGIFDDVKSYVGDDLCEIFHAADKLIDARVSYLMHKSDVKEFINKISKSIEELQKSFGEIGGLEEVVEVLKNLPKLSTDEIVNTMLATAQRKKSPNKNK